MTRISIEHFRARLAGTADTGALARLYRDLAGRPDLVRALAARNEGWVVWEGARA